MLGFECGLEALHRVSVEVARFGNRGMNTFLLVFRWGPHRSSANDVNWKNKNDEIQKERPLGTTPFLIVR